MDRENRELASADSFAHTSTNRKSILFSIVRNFLIKEGLTPGIFPAPLLLGLSGGPDSMALFHLLLEQKKNLCLDLHVAHVNHGWREESHDEQQFLKKYVESYGLPFHTTSFSVQKRSEIEARKVRFSFFASVYQKIGCQALLLGHHNGDQTETLFKQFLEGVDLFFLHGIKPINSVENMQIWRPLLLCKKESLKEFLVCRNLPFFEDETNKDSRFLRTRFRESLLPTVEKDLGKKISRKLATLSLQAQDLQRYLTKQIAPYIQLLDSQNRCIDLNSLAPFDSLELYFFLQWWFKKEKISLPRALLDLCIEEIQNNSRSREIIKNKILIQIYKRNVAIKAL